MIRWLFKERIYRLVAKPLRSTERSMRQQRIPNFMHIRLRPVESYIEQISTEKAIRVV